MKKIDVEKFLKWLDDQITETYQDEMKANKTGNYALALMASESRKTFGFVKLTITGEEDTDTADFVEEV